MRYAREQGIQTTCRGSAPGSIVTYTLGITPVDPIHYGLPFERFLNPDRVTMPDIDVDFEDDRRDEVIAYVASKYGQDRVAQIITFGTMLARAAIRDVGRVLGHSYGEVDRIAKAVPNQLGIRLDEALETSPQLREQYDADPAVKRVIGFAQQLEGVARNASTHAAGVVISREPLTELMPLQKATNSDSLMTQYEMHAIEALGLLKFDFLGLSNLTILRQAVDLVRANRGEAIDLDAIPLDDRRTFELLASGETTGIFQLESAGMRRYIRELRPTSVYDLAAMVALYRPGPMDNIPAYIRRKHGQERVTYLHPLLEPYLDKTYGIFVYQEDIMAAAIALGGFTGPEADTLGYAIRKKKSSVLRAQKEKFVTQAAERGVEPGVIDAVFKAFEPFERYGFNKAHATCYGLIAYQTAYLKANYTVEYMTSVLTAFRSNEEKVAAAVAECRRLGIAVLPPDVHASHLEFTVEGDAIRFGLLAVKNVGQGAIESIITAREDGGPYKSLIDLCSRIDLRLANRKVLESLARVGALNAFGHPGQVLLGLEDAVAAGQATQRDRISGQTSLFDMGAEEAVAFERPLPQTAEVPVRERLRWEKELLGLYLSEHPMGEVAEQVGHFVNAYSSDLRDESLDGQRVVVGGIVTGLRTVVTKAGAQMAIVTVEDLQGSIEVVVFPRLYEQTRPVWIDGRILLIAGRIDHKGEEISLLADLAVDWDDAVAKGPDAFAREVAAGDRGGRRRQPVGAAGPGANGNGNGAHAPQPVGAAAGGGEPAPAQPPPMVSPIRADAEAPPAPLPPIAPPVPVPTYVEPGAGRARRRPRHGAGRARRGARADPGAGRNVERAGRRAGGRSAPRAVRPARRPRPAGRRDGGLQGGAARPAGRDPGGDPRAGTGRRRATPHGAAAGRCLRLGPAGRGPPPARRRGRRPPAGLTRGRRRRACLRVGLALGDPADGLHRRQQLVVLGADLVDGVLVEVKLARDLVDDRGLLGRDDPVLGADREARLEHRLALLGRRQRLELAGDHVVLGVADGPRLESRHLGDEDRRRFVEHAALLELLLDQLRLLVADVHVGMRRTRQDVGSGRDQAGALRRQGLEAPDDPPDGFGLTGRRRRLGEGLLRLLGGGRVVGTEDATKHEDSLRRLRSAGYQRS